MPRATPTPRSGASHCAAAPATRYSEPPARPEAAELPTRAAQDADLGADPFDVVVSFNVRALTDPAQEATWDVVARVLYGFRISVLFGLVLGATPIGDGLYAAVTSVGAWLSDGVDPVSFGRGGDRPLTLSWAIWDAYFAD